MQKLLALFALFLASSLVYSPAALATKRKEEIKTTLEEIVSLCRAGETAKAATHFLYAGDDAARDEKDVLHPGNKEEFDEAKELCEDIVDALPASGYKVGWLSSEKEDGLTFYVLKVTTKEEHLDFYFLALGGRYVLDDFD